MGKLFVRYIDTGFHCPDAKVLSWAERLTTKASQRIADTHVHVSTHMCIDAIRIMVLRGKINHEDVMFLFEDKGIVVNKDGRIADYWWKGFADVYDGILAELLGPEWGNSTEESCYFTDEIRDFNGQTL